MKSAKSKKSPEKPLGSEKITPQPAQSSSAPEPGHTSAIPQERVAERARSLWEQRGRPSDQDLEIWLEAERQLGGKPPVRGDIKAKIDQTDPDDSLKTDVEEEMDEETTGGARRSATSL